VLCSVLELQIANVLYTPENVSALRQIRRHLDQRIEELQKSWRVGQERLESYRLLGQGFEVLAQTYAHLQNRIREKRWVLEQLQHPDDSK
jgi:septation ring formation regulator EzrA